MVFIEFNFNAALKVEHWIQTSIFEHELASEIFTRRHYWYFYVTKLILGVVGIILAILAATGVLFPEAFRYDARLITVASVTVILFTFQFTSECYGYDKRAAKHDAALIAQQGLHEELNQLKLMVELESKIANSKVNVDQRDTTIRDINNKHHTETFMSIRTRHTHSQSGCKSNVPKAISAAFRGVNDELLLARNVEFISNLNAQTDHGPFHVYEEIARDIRKSFMFPFILPNSDKLVEDARKRFEAQDPDYVDRNTFSGERLVARPNDPAADEPRDPEVMKIVFQLLRGINLEEDLDNATPTPMNSATIPSGSEDVSVSPPLPQLPDRLRRSIIASIQQRQREGGLTFSDFIDRPESGDRANPRYEYRTDFATVGRNLNSNVEIAGTDRERGNISSNSSNNNNPTDLDASSEVPEEENPSGAQANEDAYYN